MVPKNPLGGPISPQTLPENCFTRISHNSEKSWGPLGPLVGLRIVPLWAAIALCGLPLPFVGPRPCLGSPAAVMPVGFVGHHRWMASSMQTWLCASALVDRLALGTWAIKGQGTSWGTPGSLGEGIAWGGP